MIGTSIAHYKIIEKLGEGGMGEVYLAEDTKLNRHVAIKVLAEELQQDPLARKRLMREAKSAAALDHPFICKIYEAGEAENRSYVALEYVEGMTLKEKSAEGPLPLGQTLQIGVEIAEAIEKAHQERIIHRDLKPANVMLTSEGHVKVMDFGLARRLQTEGADEFSTTLTQEGSTVGTIPYMSPEQLRGDAIDARSDIFSFGVLFYEMLTGSHPFLKRTPVDTVNAILSEEPSPLTRYVPEIPVLLQHILKKMLAKEPDERYQLIHEVRTDLRELAEESVDSIHKVAIGPPDLRHPFSRSWLPWVTTALFAVIALLLALWPETPPEPPVRKLHLAEGQGRASISPDGSSILLVRDNSLWIRRLDQPEARQLEGTEGGSNHFWSPDSRFVGFVLDRKLRTISVSGGSSRTVCDLRGGFFFGASWGADDVIVFSQSVFGLQRVSAEGGDATPFLQLDRGKGDTFFSAPFVLPDNKGILFAQLNKGTIELFDGQRRRILFQRERSRIRSPVYSPTGHIIYRRTQRNDGIWAVPFSLSELEPTGDDFKLTSEVGIPSVSGDGTMVYRPQSNLGIRQLVWVSRTGEVLGTIGQPQVAILRPALSPDETQIALSAQEESARAQIWIYNIALGNQRRLSLSETGHLRPFWSVSGDQVGYTSIGQGESLLITGADGSSQEEMLAEGAGGSFSADDKYLVYEKTEPGNRDIWYLELEGDRTPQIFLRTPASEGTARLSPDGNYLAYESNETGTNQVYLKRFPSADGISMVSVERGAEPLWSKDGKELYYWNYLDNTLSVVRVDTTSNNPLRSNAERLFSANNVRANSGYDVSRDGRFLMVEAVQQPDEEAPSAIVISQNWFAEFKDRQ